MKGIYSQGCGWVVYIDNVKLALLNIWQCYSQRFVIVVQEKEKIFVQYHVKCSKRNYKYKQGNYFIWRCLQTVGWFGFMVYQP